MPPRPWVPLLLCALAPIALLWPLPMAGGAGLLGAPEAEVAAHVWGWWAFWAEGPALAWQTGLLNAPDGLGVQLIDPLNAVLWGIAAWVGGPVVGQACVIWLALSVAGAAGWALAVQAGARGYGPAIGAAAGLACPGLLSAVVDGTSEGLGVGWVGLQLAVLLSLRHRARWGRVATLALLIVLAVYAGAYNAVWVAMIDVPVGLWMLRHTRRHVWAGVASAAAALPYVWAAMSLGEGRPGAGDRSIPTRPDPLERWRGGWMEGADLLDLIVPEPILGAAAAVPHTAYLGATLVVLAALVGWRERRSTWPWWAGAVAFAALALGPWLVVGGDVVAPGGVELAAPAGYFERFTPLGRLTRWYRAGAVAVLLLGAVASRAATRAVPGLALAALVLCDLRWAGPIPASLPMTRMPTGQAFAAVDGPVAEVPPIHPLNRPEPGDENLLFQIRHGHPTTGTLDNIPGRATTHMGVRGFRRAAMGPADARTISVFAESADDLRRLGYRYVAVYTERVSGPGLAALSDVLGPPVGDAEGVVVYSLSR